MVRKFYDEMEFQFVHVSIYSDLLILSLEIEVMSTSHVYKSGPYVPDLKKTITSHAHLP